jgi:hypothetical protein
MSSILTAMFDNADDIELSDKPRELRIGDTIRSLDTGEVRDVTTDE